MTALLTQGFRNGAQLGDDNWVYFSNNNNPGTEEASSWVQLDITETTITPIRYVWDPDDPTADIIFADALVAASGIPEPSINLLCGIAGLGLFFRRRS